MNLLPSPISPAPAAPCPKLTATRRAKGFSIMIPRSPEIAGTIIRLLGSWVLSMSFTAASAAAEDGAAFSQGSAWKYTVGAGAMVMPNYEGSKHYVIRPLPMLDVSWEDTVSLSAVEGLKVTARPLPDKGFFVSGGIGYWAGRKEGVDKHHGDSLRGLGNLSGGAVGKFQTGYRLGAFRVAVDVERDIHDDRHGTTVTPNIGYAIIQRRDFRLNAKAAASWADDDYMQNMFGITPGQAASSLKHYQVFKPGAGLKDAQIGLSADYRVTSSVSVFALANVSRLLGDAADSPIVKTQGSKNQFGGGLGIAYHF